ncbi:bifunctional hydroxymethylpyrimidine kinase/phosphomethylpyrimidine kinase [Eubacteriaceae bacterium ES2]|nr:bifunctional hydroxymethylpyrimidine kinase/phosphomethylpyrimidine kinase [Eubacteriaceae bacterium ES2]
MKKVLTIAGSDSSGGAGIQADIKTITVHKMYAMSAITAITAQNTTGVYGIMDVTPEIVGKQIDCIFKDIRPDAVKIGMVSSAPIIEIIACKLQEFQAENIVIDPVMVSTSGSKLLSDDAMTSLISVLLPLGTVITPNIPEAEVLSQTSIKDQNDMIAAAKIIANQVKGAVIIKGGHLVNDAIDLLYEKGQSHWFRSPRIETKNTHGTGCTLSSAIACNLADGMRLSESIKKAKDFLTGALEVGLDLGEGSGPLNHTYKMD